MGQRTCTWFWFLRKCIRLLNFNLFFLNIGMDCRLFNPGHVVKHFIGSIPLYPISLFALLRLQLLPVFACLLISFADCIIFPRSASFDASKVLTTFPTIPFQVDLAEIHYIYIYIERVRSKIGIFVLKDSNY